MGDRISHLILLCLPHPRVNFSIFFFLLNGPFFVYSKQTKNGGFRKKKNTIDFSFISSCHTHSVDIDIILLPCLLYISRSVWLNTTLCIYLCVKLLNRYTCPKLSREEKWTATYHFTGCMTFPSLLFSFEKLLVSITERHHTRITSFCTI